MAVKSFAESVFSQSNSFRKVVMIQYPAGGCLEHHGFITSDADVAGAGQEDGGPARLRLHTDYAQSYVGLHRMVPTTEVVELEMSVDAAMKMIITCGVGDAAGTCCRA